MPRGTTTKKRPGWKDTVKAGSAMVPRCQARKRSGQQCGKTAMKGKRVCFFHGGKAGRKPTLTTLAYRKARADLQEDIEEMHRLASKIDVTDLRSEIAVAQAVLERLLASEDPDEGRFPRMVKVADQVTQMKERLVKIDLMKRQMVHLEVVTLYGLAWRALAEKFCESGKLGILRREVVELEDGISELAEKKRREQEQQLKTRV